MGLFPSKKNILFFFHTLYGTTMPAKKQLTTFYKKDGSPVTFKAKRKVSPAKTLSALKMRLRKLKSPKMRERATQLWKQARGLS